MRSRMCGVWRLTIGFTAGLAGLSLAALAFGASGPPQIDVSRATGPQTEASIAIDPTDPRVLVAASQNPYVCGIRVYGSTDSGRSWTSQVLSSPDATASRRARGPRPICAGNEWVGIDRQGRQYVVYGAYVAALSLGGPTLMIASRANPSAAWGHPVQVDPKNPGTADKPTLAIDNSASSPRSGRLYVAWTRGFNPQQVLISHSDDAGTNWSTPTLLGNGWGVHLATGSDGSLDVAWWSSTGSLLLRRSTDGGDHFSTPTAFGSFLDVPQLGVSNTPAEPAQPLHPDPSLAVDRSQSAYRGRIYAADTHPSAKGRRLYLTAFDPDGSKLFTTAIGAARLARDDFNATVAVDQSTGVVWICFYRTGSGSKRHLATYSCTTSRDGGRTWTAPIATATVPSDESVHGAFTTPTGVDSGFASYEGLAVADGVAHPIWTDTRDLRRLREEIYTTQLAARKL